MSYEKHCLEVTRGQWARLEKLKKKKRIPIYKMVEEALESYLAKK